MTSFHVAGGGKAVKDGKGHKKKKAADADEEEEETYYDAMKKDMGDRAARTKVYKSVIRHILCSHVFVEAACTLSKKKCELLPDSQWPYPNSKNRLQCGLPYIQGSEYKVQSCCGRQYH